MLKVLHALMLGSEEHLSQDLKVQFSEYRLSDGFGRMNMLAKLMGIIFSILLVIDGIVYYLDNQNFDEKLIQLSHAMLMICMISFNLGYNRYLKKQGKLLPLMIGLYYVCIFISGSALLIINFADLKYGGSAGVLIIFIFSINLFFPLEDKERWIISSIFCIIPILQALRCDLHLFQYLSHIINSIVSFLLAVFLGLYHYRRYYIPNFVQRVELETQNRQLQAVTVEQDHFARVLAHDLKEPLRTIKSFSDLLRRDLERIPGGLSANNREYLDFVGTGAQRMHFMIDELRMYVEVANFAEIGAQCSFSHCALRVRQDLNELITRTQSELSFPKTDYFLLVSEQHLIIILQNIVHNAIRYCDKSIPKININTEAKGKELQISINDNGAGIPKEDLPNIFELFWRSNRTRTKGSGIGLSTCKKIIEQYGGKLWVESQEGIGTTFYFTLPLK